MKKKIISILAFSPRQETLRKRFANDEEFIEYYRQEQGGLDFYNVKESIGKVFFYHTELFHLQAKQMLSLTDEYDIECWRPYVGIDNIYEKEIESVAHRLIPQYIKKDFFGRDVLDSTLFYKELKKEIDNNRVLFVHSFPGALMINAWLNIKPLNVPIYAIHRGGVMNYFTLKQKKSYKILTSFFRHLKEKKVLQKYIDVINDTVKVQADFIEKYNLTKVVRYFPDGVDFELYKESPDKIRAKVSLGLPKDKKIILYVGRFTKVKDVDFLIDAYSILRKQRNDIQLLLIGGNKDEEFYEYGLKKGAIMIERQSQESLAKYHQAADVYVLPTRNFAVKEFGGLGSAVIQSMASGVPVISDNLVHFEGTELELKKLGFLLQNKEAFLKNCNYILDNPEEFNDVRETARKYYDSVECTKKMINDIDELFKKYK